MSIVRLCTSFAVFTEEIDQVQHRVQESNRKSFMTPTYFYYYNSNIGSPLESAPGHSDPGKSIQKRFHPQ